MVLCKHSAPSTEFQSLFSHSILNEQNKKIYLKKKVYKKKNEQILCKNNQTVVGNGLRLQKKL